MKYILQYVYYNLLAHILFLTSSFVLVSVLYIELIHHLTIFTKWPNLQQGNQGNPGNLGNPANPGNPCDPGKMGGDGNAAAAQAISAGLVLLGQLVTLPVFD